MSDSDLSEKRIFSYPEAVALLPEVRRLTEEAYRRVEALGAAGADSRERSAVQAELDEIVGGWVRSMRERGLEVKGLWLVDFDNGSGCYCWRFPEPNLAFYHSYQDGFRGRMRIQ